MYNPNKELESAVQSAMKIVKAGAEAIEKGEKTFRCPVCGGSGMCCESIGYGQREICCSQCGISVDMKLWFDEVRLGLELYLKE